jgi:UDP-glucose 6-dehydrogenase
VLIDAGRHGGSRLCRLVSGTCFADFGHQVTCVDSDDLKIAALQADDIPIYEPDLDRLMHTNMAAQRLVFTTRAALGSITGSVPSSCTPAQGLAARAFPRMRSR